LIETVSIGSGDHVTIQLRRKGRVEQLLAGPCRNVGTDAVEQEGGIEGFGNCDSGGSGVARNEVVRLYLVQLLDDSAILKRPFIWICPRRTISHDFDHADTG
jgi:hypothetical protein